MVNFGRPDPTNDRVGRVFWYFFVSFFRAKFNDQRYKLYHITAISKYDQSKTTTITTNLCEKSVVSGRMSPTKQDKTQPERIFGRGRCQP